MTTTNRYAPVESIADLPRFCRNCGRPMRKDDYRTGYDRLTGEPTIAVAVSCPKGGYDSGHEAFVVAPRPPVSPPPVHR